MDKSFEILIVDDTPENLQMLGSMLEKEGYEVRVASDGFQAVQSAQEAPPDLILLDVMMPRMDGFEACSLIKTDPWTAHIPIIFLTAKVDIADLIRGFKTGAVDYITKPFNYEELRARVKTHLELKYSREVIEKNARELKELNLRLNDLNATKDKFFSIIAHDLRGPIGGLKLGLELIEGNPDILADLSDNGYLKSMKRTTESVYQLLDNLLVWARSQRGEIEFNPLQGDIAKLISDNIRLFETVASNKRITIKYPKLEPVLACFDHNMIHSVLRNILNNAVKFTQECGEISVSISSLKDTIQIEIADNGVGISSADQEKLFRIGGRICGRKGTHGETGSGLGLILCKEFIDRHGGRLWVESLPQKGSKFFFTLPIQLSAQSPP